MAIYLLFDTLKIKDLKPSLNGFSNINISAKDILKSALKDYDGTLILISHDRDFLDGVWLKKYTNSGINRSKNTFMTSRDFFKRKSSTI
jgi:ATP-binding cassette, subfamily F, member 3